MFYDDVAVYQDFGGIVLAREEGRHLAAALGPRKRNIILRNHGILTAGGTIAEAAAFFLALERACQTQLLVEAAVANGNTEKTFVDEDVALYTKNVQGLRSVCTCSFCRSIGCCSRKRKGSSCFSGPPCALGKI
jgi:ribulose-5-phosphate 4-epimerase/fuculose-1-phosphate aldolase